MNTFKLKPSDLLNQVYNENPPDFISVGKGGMLICDPIMLADVYNDRNCAIAKFITKYGQVFDTMAYGGLFGVSDDVFSCSDSGIAEKYTKLSDEICTDSHSILILPFEDGQTMQEIQNILNDHERGFHYEILKVKPGKYKSYLCDIDNTEQDEPGLYIKYLGE